MSNWGKVVLEIIRTSLKPGYLYGVNEAGELYCIEAKMPKPGETMVMPPFYMPREEEQT